MTQPTDTPLISIIMPSHNASKYIAETIDSVLAQTCTNWELLICDDGSTDNTQEVLQPYLADPRIRYIPLEKQPSVYRVRNIGFSHTRGEFIAFQDADDLYYPNSLEVLANVLMNKPSIKAAYGFYTCMDAQGNLVSNHGVNLILQEDGQYAIPVDSNHGWKSIMAGRCVSVLQNCMLRRSFMEAIGPFFDEATHYADVQFILRMFIQDIEAIEAVPAYTLRYRLHEKSSTKDPNQLARMLESRLKVANWLYTQNHLPTELNGMKRYFYLVTYLRTARLQLFESRPEKVPAIFMLALRNPRVSKLDCIVQFTPLLILALVPNTLYKFLFNTAKDAVNLYGHLLTRMSQAFRQNFKLGADCS